MLRFPVNGADRAPYVPNHMFYTIENSEFVFVPEAAFVDVFKSQQGQICRGSPFGEEIYKLAKSGPTQWLEIGTWNGLGSTKCILDGFASRKDDPKLISLEIDPVLFNVAEQNLLFHEARNKVTFYQGALKSTKTIAYPNESDLTADDKNCQHFFIHYEREKALYQSTTPIYPEFAPEVAVLDGGEYSGYLDWLHLDKSNLKYLCLDDTNTNKNRSVIKELEPEQWKLVKEGLDRNGWAIYEKI